MKFYFSDLHNDKEAHLIELLNILILQLKVIIRIFSYCIITNLMNLYSGFEAPYFIILNFMLDHTRINSK